jgi:hypothetical protein
VRDKSQYDNKFISQDRGERHFFYYFSRYLTKQIICNYKNTNVSRMQLNTSLICHGAGYVIYQLKQVHSLFHKKCVNFMGKINCIWWPEHCSKISLGI